MRGKKEFFANKQMSLLKALNKKHRFFYFLKVLERYDLLLVLPNTITTNDNVCLIYFSSLT